MTALEFAIAAPTLVLFIMTIVGVALDGFYQLALDDSVRTAARQLQIGGGAITSGSSLASAVCNQFGALANDCSTQLSYNVQANNTTFGAMTPVHMPSNGVLSNSFPAMGPGYNVIVQVAYPLPFAFPYIGYAVTGTGTYSIMSTTTVHVEPYS